MCNELKQPQHDKHDTMFVLAWTNIERMSWYNDHAETWVHSSFASNPDPKEQDRAYRNSCVEWVRNGLMFQPCYDQNLRMCANALLQNQGLRYTQFNALPNTQPLLNQYHSGMLDMNDWMQPGFPHVDIDIPQFENYFMPKQDMHTWLQQHDDSVSSTGAHPNETGHRLWAQQLINFIDDTNLLQNSA